MFCVLHRQLNLLLKHSKYYARKMSVLTVQTIEPAIDIAANIADIRRKMAKAATMSERDFGGIDLVAVSKFKSVENIRTCYDAGQRVFGENYFQELLEKAPALPIDIQWHFIGHLQSSKANKLIRDVPNLAVVETVDTVKLAERLNAACVLAERSILQVYIQVKTSDEDSKSGCNAGEELHSLIDYIRTSCPRLEVAGLMTIGAPDDVTCFPLLVKARDEVTAHYQHKPEFVHLPPLSLKLSMGMSADYEVAIAQGSDVIRVGSSIFGHR